jgi:hypothetical protein
VDHLQPAEQVGVAHAALEVAAPGLAEVEVTADPGAVAAAREPDGDAVLPREVREQPCGLAKLRLGRVALRGDVRVLDRRRRER